MYLRLTSFNPLLCNYICDLYINHIHLFSRNDSYIIINYSTIEGNYSVVYINRFIYNKDERQFY